MNRQFSAAANTNSSICLSSQMLATITSLEPLDQYRWPGIAQLRRQDWVNLIVTGQALRLAHWAFLTKLLLSMFRQLLLLASPTGFHFRSKSAWHKRNRQSTVLLTATTYGVRLPQSKQQGRGVPAWNLAPVTLKSWKLFPNFASFRSHAIEEGGRVMLAYLVIVFELAVLYACYWCIFIYEPKSFRIKGDLWGWYDKQDQPSERSLK